MSPEERIQMIALSLRCHRCGCWGFVPCLGIGFSLAAIFLFYKARMVAGEHWNPAERHLRKGMAYGVTGLLISLVTVVFVLAL